MKTRRKAECIRLENECLSVDVVPAVGGRVISIFDKERQYEFLWRNAGVPLRRLEVGADYDENFYGGIDELLPNDVAEMVQGVMLPDHGEIWTMEMQSALQGGVLTMSGTLPIYGLEYEKSVSLRPNTPHLDIAYKIRNPTQCAKPFLWKLHAALNINEGDQIVCPARMARAVGSEWTRWKTTQPFSWPLAQGGRADFVPRASNKIDFLYLYELQEGLMGWQSKRNGLGLFLRFATDVFRYCWLFASYGGFLGHYTAILEPCTTMPISLLEAAKLGQCSVLDAGRDLTTRVSIYAGPTDGLKSPCIPSQFGV